MQFDAFLLDQWIERKFSSGWRIAHDFSASSGPEWSVGELLELGGQPSIEEFLRIPITYPSAAGSLELRTAIAEFEAVSPDDIQVVTGAQEGLLAIFFTAAKSGLNVILPHPGFPPFTALPKGLGLEVRHYHLRPENGFGIDVEEVKHLADARTALMLVNSPHNPTGMVLSETSRRALHDFCVDRNIQFVCDQVFHPNYYGAATPSAATLPHTTVVGDFSKALCLPGLRIGWIVDRNHDRLERYREARTYFTVSNGPITERLAVLAMRHREAIHSRARDASLANLRVIESTWPAEHETMVWVKPRGGFTVFPWVRGESDTRQLCERLGERGILVVPGDCFDMPSHVRVGFGSQRERFAEGLARLNGELNAYFSERRRRSTVVA
jgi:aspartate/methionine/tyrosine aminotransferase